MKSGEQKDSDEIQENSTTSHNKHKDRSQPGPLRGGISVSGNINDSVILIGNKNTVNFANSSDDTLINLPPARTDTSSIQIPFFVGREREIARIQSVWDQLIIDKSLRLVMVEGIPGMGKTALVEMFLKRSIDERSAFYEVKCKPETLNDALAPFRIMFSGDGDEFKQNMDTAGGSQPRSLISSKNSERKQTSRFSRFVISLKDEAQSLNGLVLFFDDTQWMDETSMGLLHYMSEMLAGIPILIILAYRSSEIRKRKDFYASLVKLRTDRSSHVSVIQLLEGISAKEYADQRFPGNLFDSKFIQSVQKTINGHAFVLKVFFEDLFQRKIIYEEPTGAGWALKETKMVIPKDAWTAIESQVRGVDANKIALIKSASCEGETFTLEILATLRQLPLDELEDFLQIFVDLEIVEPGEYTEFNSRKILQYKFSHSLYREYFYKEQKVNERRKNHAQLAGAIRKFYGANNLAQVASQLSAHFEEADDIENAFEFAFMAGKEARKRFSWQQERYWAEKCELFIKNMEEGKVDLAKISQVAIMWADGPADTPEISRSIEKKLRATIKSLDDARYARTKCEALISLAYVHYDLGISKAAQTAKMAVELAEEINDLELQYEAVSILSDIFVDNDENFEEGETTILQAIKLAEELNDPYKLAGALASFAWLLTDLGKNDEAYECAARAVEIATNMKFEEDSLKAYILRMAATAFEAKRDFKQAIENYEKSMSIYKNLGDKVKICWILYDLGDCYAQLHNFPKAVEYFNVCIAEAKKIDNKDSMLYSLVSWADLDLRENRPESAAIHLAGAEIIMQDKERDATPQDILEFKTSQSLLKFHEGDVATAEKIALEVIQEAKYDVDRFFPYLQLGIFASQTADMESAKKHLAKSAKIALDMDDPYWLALSHEQIGNVCILENDLFGAVYHYEFALKKVAGFYHESGLIQISRKIANAQELIGKSDPVSTGELLRLSRSHSAFESQLTITYVSRQIFLKKYFTNCLDCGFCLDSCCSYGADIDITNVNSILALGGELTPFIRQTDAELFDPEYSYDSEYPGSLFTRTRVHGDRCVFISKDQRGCGLHRYAASKGIDYHALKPFICSLFPITFGYGILSPALELADDSLICVGSGPSAYQGVRSELKYYFGQGLVDELDAIERSILPQGVT